MAPQGTAREYVESYVKEQDVQDYLSQQQPKYDPHKAQQQASETSRHEADAQERQRGQQKPHSSQSIHLPTVNPIPATDNQQTNEEQREEQQQPQIVWTYRDAADQRKEIHNAAQDNCADLHAELWSCFKDGSWWDKAKMCEAQKQKFWACYNKQKKFLKEANYKGPINVPEQDDKILQEALLLPRDD
ncbi:hypothetical protein BCR43DRAFT_527164 [Syncephalastrum racemosum]|uniref:Uncharacterized protein n=1 Tax=Syncephalastrum racemosum TaxID=13706 RepID=A0A1X2H214_SYNRA|nr:hypothetical protein BCR43DRAFT_527164 [Syncephalastrum racemosum]